MSSLKAQLVYSKPPKNFNPKVEVAACFIKVQDQFLFLKRQSFKSEGNTWGIPGGKLEKGEKPEQAVIREVQEETGINIVDLPIKYFGRVYIRYSKNDFIYHMFEVCLADYPTIVIDQNEHAEHKWLFLKQALEYPLIPGEDECIHLAYNMEKDYVSM